MLYYRKGDDDDSLVEAVSGIMAIKEEATLNDIYFVLVSDHREFAKLGVEESPALVYYENNIPFLYRRNLKVWPYPMSSVNVSIVGNGGYISEDKEVCLFMMSALVCSSAILPSCTFWSTFT